MPDPIVVVDAFADRPFAGNPAAVCVLPGPRDPAWMALVAREMNLAETAFLHRQDDGFALRWFTPTTEVDLCGHATLASAHVLWQEGWLPGTETARFHTRSGLLTARRAGGLRVRSGRAHRLRLDDCSIFGPAASVDIRTGVARAPQPSGPGRR